MAAMRAVDPRVSFAELQQWPDDPREGRRYELYDGEVIVVPSPIARHQRVAGHILDILTDYERTNGGLAFVAPIDIVFSPYDVLQPDLVYFREERRHLIDMWDTAQVPPDLAVEVLSRSTEARDRGRKMNVFARFGVAEYWIVDPIENTLEIYTNSADGFVLSGTYGEGQHVTSPTLLDLRFSTDLIFAE